MAYSLLIENLITTDYHFEDFIQVYTTFFKGMLRAHGRYLSPFRFVENIRAKRGIKKSDITHSKHDKIGGPAHQNYHEQKGRRIPDRAITHLNGPFEASRGFIPWLKTITGIPETNLRRWQQMLMPDPMWRPWRKCAERDKRIFSDDEEAALVSFVRENYIVPGLIFTERHSNSAGSWRSHSQNRWQTSESLHYYMVNLRFTLGPGQIHLLLDSYFRAQD
jgi:hypothetical protein